jgi:hypothetical protein
MKTRITMKDVLAIERGDDPGPRFTVNYARHQYGNRIAKIVAGLILSGRGVVVAQGGDGFLVDGSFRRWNAVGQEPVSMGPGYREFEDA